MELYEIDLMLQNRGIGCANGRKDVGATGILYRFPLTTQHHKADEARN